MAIKITQGDKIVLTLRAPDQNLTGASLETIFVGEDGAEVEIPNGQHTVKDQSTYPGQFEIALTAENTLAMVVGSGSRFVTKITQTETILQYHGVITVRASPFNED